MNYEQVQKLNPADFKRYCGLHQETFKEMVKIVKAEKVLNRQLAKERIIIENIHRSLNIFRILSSRYRNRRRRFGLRFNLIAGRNENLITSPSTQLSELHGSSILANIHQK